MIAWSSLQKLGTSAKSIVVFSNLTRNGQNFRGIKTSGIMKSGGSFEIKPSSWQWNKFKDFVHFYTMVGCIPIFTIIFVTNVFIGPATLSEIPEGYTPDHWEYHKHPITRFIAKYFHPSPQEVYEKKMDRIYEQDEMKKIKALTMKLDDMMAEKEDYQLYYYKPISIRNFRRREEEAHDIRDRWAGN